MDQKELQQQIATFFAKLPPKAQASFASMIWLEVLKDLCQKYSLNKEQIETLSTETTLVLLGVIHPEEYEQALKNELNLSKEIVEKILLELNNSILKDIRPELAGIFENNIEKFENKEIDARFKELPKEIQDAIGEANYQESLYEAFREGGLNIEQMGIVENDIVEVLLGNLSTDKFTNSIKEKLGFSEEKTQTLVNIINNQIFKKIRNQVLAVNREGITDKEDEIMKSAGIEITKEDARITQNIPTQKLLDSVKTPIVQTQHSLMNVSKTNTPINGAIKTLPQTPAPKNPPIASSRIMSDIKPASSNTAKISPSYSLGKDPYRLSPEE